jgi:beta-lactamase regulating signal transducer with metallopeptidase domain
VETLLRIGLSNALSATVLAALVAVAAFACRRRPALVHGLWLVVLLKLIAPPLATLELAPPWPPSPQGTPTVEPPARIDPATSEPPPIVTQDSVEPPGPETALRNLHDAALPTEPLPTVVANPIEVAKPDHSSAMPLLESGRGSFKSIFLEVAREQWRSWVFEVWLVGSVAWAGLCVVRVGRFARLLREAIPTPDEPRRRVEELSARLGLARPPRVDLVPGAISPLLWALGTTPRLLVPEALWDRLDDAQRDGLILHELAHLKRRDHWVRLLEMAVGVVYWWHPIAWWARRGLREAEEQCCDAWVVWALPESPRAYATALVESVEFLSQTRAVVPMGASGLGQFRHLSRRIAMIMKGKTPRDLSWVGLLGLLALAALLLPWAPSLARQLDPPVESPTVAVQTSGDALEAPIAIEEGPLALADDPASDDQLADARDELELLELQIQTKKSSLKSAQAQLEYSRRATDRVRALEAKGAISREEVDKIQYDQQSAEALVATREAEMHEAELKSRIAKRRLARLEQPRLAPRIQARGPAGGPAMGMGTMGPGPAGMMAGGPPAPGGSPASSAANGDVENLTKIGLAMHNYHDVYGTFPSAAIVGREGKPLLSWRVRLLPFLGQEALYSEFRLDQAWDSAHNKNLLRKMPPVYRSSGRESSAFTTLARVIVGPDAAFEGTEGQPISTFHDGTSNTILVATPAVHPVPWTKPEDLSGPFHN